MKVRPDLLDAQSPPGLEVVQLTDEPGVPHSHIYMEAPIFAPDSRRFLLHRSAHAHGSRQDDPEHRYLVCDLENGCALTPVTEEIGATAPAVSPDGTWVYYFVNQTKVGGGGRLTLKRVGLDGTRRETLLVLDTPLPGTRFWPSRIYPLATISADGRCLALPAFLGDGQTQGAPWGLMVFDLAADEVRLILHGPTWCNLHPQYCRSTDPETSRDILVQENHDNLTDAGGNVRKLVGGLGADIHLIRDDGTNLRNLPWGRDGEEHCQGHQCWWGCSTWAITSTNLRTQNTHHLVAGTAASFAGHIGRQTPGGVRLELSRDFTCPQFCHFSTDLAGRRLVADTFPADEGGRLLFATLPPPESAGRLPDTAVLSNVRFLLKPRCDWKKKAHPHAFLSPDGTKAFFNSDESGVLQAYMIRGLDAI